MHNKERDRKPVWV